MTYRKHSLLIGFTILSASAMHAQTPAARPEFEVASVKPHAPGARGGVIGSKSPGTFGAENMPVRVLIQQAYGDPMYLIEGGPAWINREGCDVTAKSRVEAAPGPITKAAMDKSNAEMQLMLQALLEDRSS